MTQGRDADNHMIELLAEQLRLPLVQIRQLIELGGSDNAQSVSVIAAQSLRALDAFLLTKQASALRIEPVAVGAVLYDVAHELAPLAKQYGRTIELDHRARYGSLMTDRQHLQSVLSLVGEAMITSPINTHDIVLGTHSSQRGVIAGVFASRVDVSSRQRSADLYWQKRASWDVAEQLAAQLQTNLRGYRHASLPGVGVRLSPSRQLRMFA